MACVFVPLAFIPCVNLPIHKGNNKKLQERKVRASCKWVTSFDSHLLELKVHPASRYSACSKLGKHGLLPKSFVMDGPGVWIPFCCATQGWSLPLSEPFSWATRSGRASPTSRAVQSGHGEVSLLGATRWRTDPATGGQTLLCQPAFKAGCGSPEAILAPESNPPAETLSWTLWGD